MLISFFSPAAQDVLFMLMVMPSVLAGFVGVLGALATKLTDNLWLKILFAATPAIFYIAFSPVEVILVVLTMYCLGLALALLMWGRSF